MIKRLLVNGGTAADAPTAANILDAFNMLRQTRENDTVMLFVSGHGVNEGPDYQFAPTDAAWGSETLLRQSSVVPWHAFAEALTGANGRRIVFLDTCHAGNAFNRRFLSDGYEANITFYSSAGPDQDAQEDGALGGGHGLFTYALVEGVNGAARDGAGEVHADGLHGFLKSPRGCAGRETFGRAGAAIFPRPRRGELRARPAVVAGCEYPESGDCRTKRTTPHPCPSPRWERGRLEQAVVRAGVPSPIGERDRVSKG